MYSLLVFLVHHCVHSVLVVQCHLWVLVGLLLLLALLSQLVPVYNKTVIIPASYHSKQTVKSQYYNP